MPVRSTERLERDLAAVDAELKALRTEAADEVGEARTDS